MVLTVADLCRILTCFPRHLTNYLQYRNKHCILSIVILKTLYLVFLKLLYSSIWSPGKL